MNVGNNVLNRLEYILVIFKIGPRIIKLILGPIFLTFYKKNTQIEI